MEPTLGTAFVDLGQFIIWPYLLIFILLSSLVKKAFGHLLLKITRVKWLPVYTVGIIAAAVGIPYGIVGEVTWVQVIITYALGTSFYELLWEAITKVFIKLVQRITG